MYFLQYKEWDSDVMEVECMIVSIQYQEDPMDCEMSEAGEWMSTEMHEQGKRRVPPRRGRHESHSEGHRGRPHREGEFESDMRIRSGDMGGRHMSDLEEGNKTDPESHRDGDEDMNWYDEEAAIHPDMRPTSSHEAGYLPHDEYRYGGYRFRCGTVEVEYEDTDGYPRTSTMHENVDQEDSFPEVKTYFYLELSLYNQTHIMSAFLTSEYICFVSVLVQQLRLRL